MFRNQAELKQIQIITMSMKKNQTKEDLVLKGKLSNIMTTTMKAVIQVGVTKNTAEKNMDIIIKINIQIESLYSKSMKYLRKDILITIKTIMMMTHNQLQLRLTK